MASRFNFQKAWTGDKGTYPIVAVIAGASLLSLTFVSRTILKNPDVTWNKHNRSQPISNLYENQASEMASFRSYSSHRGGFARISTNEITENRDAAYAEGKGSIFKFIN
jgi:hypothetical protein